MSAMEISRRTWTRRAFLGTLGLGGVGVAVPPLLEARWLEVRHVRLPLLPYPFRVVHLTDLHWSRVVPESLIEEAVEETVTLRPDLICLTGDFISHPLQRAGEFTAILSRLTAVAPTFACLGNHDGGVWAAKRGGDATPERVRAILDNAGIDVLNNRRVRLSTGTLPLHLIGVGDLWSGMCRPEAVEGWQRGQPAAEAPPTLLLNHNPDAKSLLLPYPWHLMLCGHTHGGQVVLPLLGTRLAPVEDPSLIDGYYDWENRGVHISKGVGAIKGIRVNCRPDITCLDLGGSASAT